MKKSVIAGLSAVLVFVGPVLGEPVALPSRPDDDGVRRHGIIVFDVKVNVVSKMYKTTSCSASIYLGDHYKKANAEAKRIDSKTYACRIRLKYDFADVIPWDLTMRSEVSVLSYQGSTSLDPVNVTTAHQLTFDAPKNGSTLTIPDALTL